MEAPGKVMEETRKVMDASGKYFFLNVHISKFQLIEHLVYPKPILLITFEFDNMFI